MDIHEFFHEVNIKTRPIFVTTEEMTVSTFVWNYGSIPEAYEQVFTIPVGTELVLSGVGNFGTGYAMNLLHPRKVFTGLHATRRWFKCPYESMKFSRREYVNI